MPDGDDAPVRVRLRYPDVATFVERFAPNVTRGGLFIASREPRAVATVFRFELALADDTLVFSGEGRVTWVKPFNPAEPNKAHGMGVQFIYVDPDSRPILERLLQNRDPARRPTGSVPVITASTTPPTGTATPAYARKTTREIAAKDAKDDTFDEWVEPSVLRRTLDRARLLSARTDDLDALLAPDQEEPATLSQALQELPRLLSRRNTGLIRIIPEMPSGDGAVSDAPDAAATSGNGENR